MQSSPTPVPDHGTGWGLLFLFIYLYGAVTLLGIGAIVAFGLHQFGRRIPAALQYLMGIVLLGAVGIGGFIVLVAATAQMYDVVALVLLIVFVPLTLVILHGHRRSNSQLAIIIHAAMAWSLPFLIGFGIVAFVGSRGSGISPVVAGVVAVVIVVGGTIILDRLSVYPDGARTLD